MLKIETIVNWMAFFVLRESYIVDGVLFNTTAAKSETKRGLRFIISELPNNILYGK